MQKHIGNGPECQCNERDGTEETQPYAGGLVDPLEIERLEGEGGVFLKSCSHEELLVVGMDFRTLVCKVLCLDCGGLGVAQILDVVPVPSLMNNFLHDVRRATQGASN